MSPLFLIAALTMGDLPPEKEVEIPMECGATTCTVPIPLLKELLMAHNWQVEEIKKLRDQIDTMKTIKGCAKVEVLPKLKKERDL